MPSTAISAITTLANWQALQADGVTPSAALAVTEDSTMSTPSGDSRSIVFAAAPGAADHLARCSFAALNLDAFDELRLVLHSDIAAGGSAYAELRLGSAALPIGAPGNDWHRRLPLAASAWDTVRVSIDDLPAAVRGAVIRLQLHVLDDAREFELRLDEAVAVRPRMVTDVEQGLISLLHNRLTLGGNPVPALVTVAGVALPATRPLIAIVPMNLRAAVERAAGSAQRCDFVLDGYRLRSPAAAYELGYALEALASTRAAQAEIIDFLLSVLSTQGTLRVAAQSLTYESVPAPDASYALTPVPTPRQRLHYRVWAWRTGTSATPVLPVTEVVTNVDWKERVHA